MVMGDMKMLWGNNKKEEPTFEVARNNDTITVTINGEMATKIKKFDRVVKQMQGIANDPELSKLKWYSNSVGELLEMAVQTIQKSRAEIIYKVVERDDIG